MSPKTLLSRIILLITVGVLVACTTSTVPPTPTAVPTLTAEPTAAMTLSTYHGVALPTPEPVRRDEVQPPPVWLIIGDSAVLASYGSFCFRNLLRSGCADAPAAWGRPNLATATLPAETQAVVVVGSGAVAEFQATVRPWIEEPDFGFSAMRSLRAEATRDGNVMVFTLEPTGEEGDQLLEVSITYNLQGDAIYFWRLNPAQAPKLITDQAAAALPSVEIPTSCIGQSEDYDAFASCRQTYVGP